MPNIDYTITWDYIVSRMESKFGLRSDNTEPLSFGEIEKYIEDIWKEYFDKLYEYESNKVLDGVSHVK